MKKNKKNSLLIASNRLPVTIKEDHGKYEVTPSSGGLVTAMAPILRDRGGIWVGWPGIIGDKDLTEILKPGEKEAGFDLEPIALSQKEHDDFYYGFSNEVIWPLFHDLQTLCNFDPAYYQSYDIVNTRFADRVLELADSVDYIWVHDYHLMSVAQKMREKNYNSGIGFFLHIPFPPLDIFLKLPWRSHILNSLLNYDLIGFQTLRDRRNFMQCIRALLPQVKVEGKGSVVRLRAFGRSVKLGAFPISIDYDLFEKEAKSAEVENIISDARDFFKERFMMLGVDRLDYTKGIPYRLRAFGEALEKYPELRGKMTLIQVVVPSRVNITEYQLLKKEIGEIVSNINGRFSQTGWIPVHYMFRSLDRSELIAYYRMADGGLITPLKDGMNLVCKEFCACQIESDATLILSEFAGAAPELHKHSFLVNPYDIEGMADTIYEAFKTNSTQRKKKMRLLRKAVKNNTIFDWVDHFLQEAISRTLSDYPHTVDDYIPQLDAPE